jgi:hypothetical protein
VKSIRDDGPVVFLVGGNLGPGYTDQEVSISKCLLSASQAITRISDACEEHVKLLVGALPSR